MNYKTTVMLVLLFLLVGGYFYYFEYGQVSRHEAHQQQSQQDEAPEGEVLFKDLDGLADSIDKVTIERGGKRITLTKEADRWYQTEPVRFPLNEYAPASLSEKIAQARYLEGVKTGEPSAPTMEQMGLADPRAVVTVSVGDNQTILQLGKVTFGGNGYVRIAGDDTAYVVGSELLGAILDQTVNDWRSTSLDIPEASSASAANLFESKGYDIFLVKDDGRWRFDAKSVQRASQSAIEDWFAAAGRVWINGFVEDNPGDLKLYGLDEDYLRIQFVEPGVEGVEVKHTLHIGSTDLEDANRYAAWTRDTEPVTVVFTVTTSSVEGLAQTLNDLTDSSVIDADIYGVRRLVVEQDGRTTLDLIRDPQTGYSFGGADPGYMADYITSHNMLTRLCELESTDLVNDISSLGGPIASVKITLAADGGEKGFAVYRQDEQTVVVSDGETVGYLVGAGELDTLLGTPLGLRDLTLVELDPDLIDRVKLQRDDGQLFEFIAEGVSDGVNPKAMAWRLDGYGNDFETEAFEQMLDSFNPLRVDRWLSEPVEPLAGWILVNIVPNGGTPLALRVDPLTGEALMSGVDLAFVLPGSLVNRLMAEYRDRTVLNIGIDQIQSVKLVGEKTGVLITRDGVRYAIDVGEVDQAEAAAVFDSLSGLRVELYTQPLSLSPEDIDFTIEVTAGGGESVILRVLKSEGDTATATLDGPRGEGHRGWFTLSREVIGKLRTPLTEAEVPIK